MTEPKKYKIETIEDILKVVTLENKENFLKDFSNFLDFRLTTGAISEVTEGKVKVVVKNSFNWIDDGKNNVNITIQVKEE